MTPAERLRIQDFVADCAEDAKRAVKGGDQYKATVLLRAPHLPDGDVLVTEDDPDAIIAAIERMKGRQP